MVVPGLRNHLQGDNEADDAGENRTCEADFVLSGGKSLFRKGCFALVLGAALAEELADERPQTGHTHAEPDSEGIEGACEGVVTLAGLGRGLVEVEHDGDTCHEKEEEDYPELFDAALGGEGLPAETDYAHEERKHEEYVVALVALAVGVGEEALVTEAGIVDEGYARNPVAVVDLAVALDVVLTTGEIPHEIAPVHVVELVDEEEAEAFAHGRLDGVDRLKHFAVVDIAGSADGLALESADPVGVGGGVGSAVDAWEEHIELGSHDIVLLVACDFIVVGLVGRCLDNLCVEGLTFFIHRRCGALGVDFVDRRTTGWSVRRRGDARRTARG